MNMFVPLACCTYVHRCVRMYTTLHKVKEVNVYTCPSKKYVRIRMYKAFTINHAEHSQTRTFFLLFLVITHSDAGMIGAFPQGM